MSFLDTHSLENNRLETALQERRTKGLATIDLVDTNPTKNGLIFPSAILAEAAAAYWHSRVYSPDPQGLPAARAAIAEYYRERAPQAPLSADNIFITAGSSESYAFVFSLLCNPGDNVLVPEPCYPLFDLLAEHQHIELRPYRLSEARGWEIDFTSLDASLDRRTKAIVIISPHNPTGAVHAKRYFELSELKLPIVCDEVFSEFVHAFPRTPLLGALYPELPVFHLNGISKMLALPDLKLAWIALNDCARERYGTKLSILNDTFLSANSLAQHMLPSLLEKSAAFRERMYRTVRENLALATDALLPLPGLLVTSPQGAYFLFPELAGGPDEESVVLHLLGAGVLCHPGYFYGSRSGSHLMISCLKERSQLAKGLEILQSAWPKLSHFLHQSPSR